MNAAGMDGHRESRKRLVPFLESMIGSCPGVVWHNKQEGSFRIPWRHLSNREWEKSDSAIFMEWAKHTGRYNRNADKPDWPGWKTRLRCALTKISEIEEVKSAHCSSGPHPYRVYKFVRRKVSHPKEKYVPGATSIKADGVSVPPSSAVQGHDTEPKEFQDYILTTSTLTCAPQQLPSVVTEMEKRYSSTNDMNYSCTTEHTDDGQFKHYYQAPIGTEQFLNYFQNPKAETVEQMPDTTTGNELLPAEWKKTGESIDNGNRAIQSCEPADSLPSDLDSVSSTDLVQVQRGERLMSLPSSMSFSSFDMQSMQSSITFTLTLYYGFDKNIEVLQRSLSSKGCRLYFNCPELINEDKVEEVPLPAVDSINQIDEKQRKLIQQILVNMERGLELTVLGNDVYAQRFCKTRIFVSDGRTYSTLLGRGDTTPVKIVDGIKDISKDAILLTIGQEIKRNERQPLGRVMMCIEVKCYSSAPKSSGNNSLESNSMPLISKDAEADKVHELLKALHL